MKRRIVGVGCALAVLAVPVAATAGSGTDRATGGGQVLIGTRGGAGDTIAFSAQGTSAAGKGQLQYVDRTATGQTVYHGSVQCVAVDGNMAKIAGTWSSGDNFNLFAEDNGEGAKATGSDMIFIDSMADDASCDFDTPGENDQLDLARGNAQVYDAP